jgi:hypothetical protein
VSRNWQNYLDVMMATNRFEWPLLYQWMNVWFYLQTLQICYKSFS